MIWLLSQPVVVIDGVRYPPAEFGHVLSKFPWAIIHGIPALIIWNLYDRWRELGRNVVVGEIVHMNPETGMMWVKVDGKDRELPYDGPAAEFVWNTYVGATSGMPWESKSPEETDASIHTWITEASEAELRDLKFVAMTPGFFTDEPDHLVQLGYDLLGDIMAFSYRERGIPAWSDFSELLSNPTGKMVAVRAFEVLVALDPGEAERVASFLRPFLDERYPSYFWVGVCTVYGRIGTAEALSVLRRLGESPPDDPEAVDIYKAIIDDVRIKLGIAL